MFRLGAFGEYDSAAGPLEYVEDPYFLGGADVLCGVFDYYEAAVVEVADGLVGFVAFALELDGEGVSSA